MKLESLVKVKSCRALKEALKEFNPESNGKLLKFYIEENVI